MIEALDRMGEKLLRVLSNPDLTGLLVFCAPGKTADEVRMEFPCVAHDDRRGALRHLCDSRWLVEGETYRVRPVAITVLRRLLGDLFVGIPVGSGGVLALEAKALQRPTCRQFLREIKAGRRESEILPATAHQARRLLRRAGLLEGTTTIKSPVALPAFLGELEAKLHPTLEVAA